MSNYQSNEIKLINTSLIDPTRTIHESRSAT